MSAPPPDRWSERLSAARAGSSEALGQALDECRAYLLQIAREELGSELQAKGGASDLVQDTFLEAHRSFGRFHGESTVELRAWLRCLLRHQAARLGRRYRRSQKRRVAREVAAGPAMAVDATTPSTQAMAEEQRQLLHEAIARLPEDHRRVMTLRYLVGLTFEEIGAVMQRSPDAARMLWGRALERLKHELRIQTDTG